MTYIDDLNNFEMTPHWKCDDPLCTVCSHRKRTELAGLLYAIYTQNDKDYKEGLIGKDQVLGEPITKTITSTKVPHERLTRTIQDQNEKAAKIVLKAKPQGAASFIEIVPNYKNNNEPVEYRVLAHILLIPTKKPQTDGPTTTYKDDTDNLAAAINRIVCKNINAGVLNYNFPTHLTLDVLIPVSKQVEDQIIRRAYGILRITRIQAYATQHYFQYSPAKRAKISLTPPLKNPWFNPNEEDDTETGDGDYNSNANNPKYLTAEACIERYINAF